MVFVVVCSSVIGACFVGGPPINRRSTTVILFCDYLPLRMYCLPTEWNSISQRDEEPFTKLPNFIYAWRDRWILSHIQTQTHWSRLQTRILFSTDFQFRLSSHRKKQIHVRHKDEEIFGCHCDLMPSTMKSSSSNESQSERLLFFQFQPTTEYIVSAHLNVIYLSASGS